MLHLFDLNYFLCKKTHFAIVILEPEDNFASDFFPLKRKRHNQDKQAINLRNCLQERKREEKEENPCLSGCCGDKIHNSQVATWQKGTALEEK